MAHIFVGAAYALGDNIHTRINLMLTQLKAHGDLKQTVTCILEVLGKHEISHAAQGQALRASDPKRHNTKRTWIEGKDELCSVCKGAHGEGASTSE